LQIMRERPGVDALRGSYEEFLEKSAICHPPLFNVSGHLF